MQPGRLKQAAAELGVRLDAQAADRLIAYADELVRWNARFNLISRRDVGRLWPRHILDSLSIAPLLIPDAAEPGAVEAEGPVAVDLGTGAGLPGLPLAVALPAVRWRLIDRNQRKIRFLEAAIRRLGLTNVTAAVQDVGGEPVGPLAGGADLLVSRAVADPAELVRLGGPLLKPRGRFILMTGAAGAEAAGSERQPADPGNGYRIADVHELAIPGLDRTHEVTIIERQ